MKLIEIKLKCGYPGCPEVGVEGDGLVVTETIRIGRRKPVEVDICKPHYDSLFNGKLAALEADGRPVEEPKRPRSSKKATDVSAGSPQADGLHCQVADCAKADKPFKGGAGLAVHVTSQHGYPSLEAYYQDYPRP
jgi:hypothetical protein